MKRISLISILITLSCAVNAQLINPGFESWSPSVNQPVELPDHWAENTGNNQFGTVKDSLAHGGNYALTLSRWYYYVSDHVLQAQPINYRPVALNGFYKYHSNLLNDGITDVAIIQVWLLKWNEGNQQNDTIGTAESTFDAAAEYTSFASAINYINELVPDSIVIRIAPTIHFGDGTLCDVDAYPFGYCSYFTVDDLSLHAPLGIETPSSGEIMISPNPAGDFIRLGNYKGMVQVFDVAGKLVLTGSSVVDVRELVGGVYFVKVDGGWGKFVKKINVDF